MNGVAEPRFWDLVYLRPIRYVVEDIRELDAEPSDVLEGAAVVSGYCDMPHIFAFNV